MSEQIDIFGAFLFQKVFQMLLVIENFKINIYSNDIDLRIIDKMTAKTTEVAPLYIDGNREADQRLCFRYSDSTIIIPLLLKSKISSF